MTYSRLAQSAKQLLEAARSHTGIDLVDHEAEPSLTALLASLNIDSSLHAVGAKAMQKKLLRLLSNRLRMQRDIARHPEILQQVIRPPVVICGAARTGTTQLQQLLATSGDFNTLAFWQVINPSLLSGDFSEPTAPRIAEAQAFIQQFDAASPKAKKAHQFSVQGVEEETLLLEQSLHSPSFSCWSPVTGYELTLNGQTMNKALAYLKSILQYLQWQGLASPNKRWLLKCPWYFGSEAAVMAAFPQVQLLITHRHPSDTLPSMLNLLAAFHQVYSNKKPNTTQWVIASALAAKNHMQERNAAGKGLVHDILFDALTQKTEAVIERVYDFINEPLTSQAVCAIQRASQNTVHVPSLHRKGLSDYGIKAETINTLFADYLNFIAIKA